MRAVSLLLIPLSFSFTARAASVTGVVDAESPRWVMLNVGFNETYIVTGPLAKKVAALDGMRLTVEFEKRTKVPGRGEPGIEITSYKHGRTVVTIDPPETPAAGGGTVSIDPPDVPIHDGPMIVTPAAAGSNGDRADETRPEPPRRRARRAGASSSGGTPR